MGIVPDGDGFLNNGGAVGDAVLVFDIEGDLIRGIPGIDKVTIGEAAFVILGGVHLEEEKYQEDDECLQDGDAVRGVQERRGML